MPNMDGTGPRGQGSLTGRGLGACNKATESNNQSRGNGRGLRKGLGRQAGARPVNQAK